MKVKNLEWTSLLLATLCEKLEKLVVLIEDPRMGAKSRDILQAVLHLVEGFLCSVQSGS